MILFIIWIIGSIITYYISKKEQKEYNKKIGSAPYWTRNDVIIAILNGLLFSWIAVIIIIGSIAKDSKWGNKKIKL